jgi:hypothetical protein
MINYRTLTRGLFRAFATKAKKTAQETAPTKEK